ncbi:MAG TPA: Fe-S cluster assembly protein SufD, partial [Gemmatimonadaceae bacterium]|nr:Fe-S cluster assembly protein SufD [Gemmatimonadaceae bacterium]
MSTAAFLDDVRAATERDGEPRWLRDLRARGAERFAAVGFPTTRDEDWKYTSAARIAELDVRAISEPGGEVTRETLAPYTFGQGAWTTLVFVNGRYDAELSSAGVASAGVRVLPLAEAREEMEDVVRDNLGTIGDVEQTAFIALNAALHTDGAVIHLAQDAVADAPIHLLFVADAAAAKGASHPRILIVAERNSKATVVESYVATGEAVYFTNAVTEISLADGATVTHLKIQRESPRAFHVGTIDARQGRDSHFVSFSFATGAALSRTNVWTILGGEGCGATLNGLYMADGSQHVDHQTRIEHQKENCYSREVYRGVLDDTAHGVFNGKVYVHPEAQKTDGKQENHTLLLSPRAQIDTKPQLEIFADDVKCTHGAAIGQLDEDALFYLQARGLTFFEARDLLI